jgi:protein-tyrosine phosphatase
MRRAAVEKMLSVNRLLAIDRAHVYRDMFRALLAYEGPALIHCSAGKDRTGFGAALILSLLGVPRDTIMDDYLLTNEYTDPGAAMRWYANYLGVDFDLSAAEPMFGVQADFLQFAFDSIEREFGGLERYFRDAMELDAAAIGRLRERYLE